MSSQPSQNRVYLILGGIIALAIIGFGGYKLWHHFSKGAMMQSNNIPSTANQLSPSQAAVGNSGLPNKTDTSNQQLDQDVQSVQNSLNQLQKDQTTSNNDSTSQSQDIPQQ